MPERCVGPSPIRSSSLELTFLSFHLNLRNILYPEHPTIFRSERWRAYESNLECLHDLVIVSSERSRPLGCSGSHIVMDLSSEEGNLFESTSPLIVHDLSAVIDPSEAIPPHRSHDPQNNLKRTDPFQFGSRFLNKEDNVFEFNAWDHVEADDTYKEYAELQYAKQREAPVSDFDKSEFAFHF